MLSLSWSGFEAGKEIGEHLDISDRYSAPSFDPIEAADLGADILGVIRRRGRDITFGDSTFDTLLYSEDFEAGTGKKPPDGLSFARLYENTVLSPDSEITVTATALGEIVLAMLPLDDGSRLLGRTTVHHSVYDAHDNEIMRNLLAYEFRSNGWISVEGDADMNINGANMIPAVHRDAANTAWAQLVDSLGLVDALPSSIDHPYTHIGLGNIFIGARQLKPLLSADFLGLTLA